MRYTEGNAVVVGFGGMNGGEIVNFYMVESPLHYLSASAIASAHEKDACNILCYLKERVEAFIERSEWDEVVFLPWPRFYPEGGLAGRWKRLKRNVVLIRQLAAGYREIRIHAPAIDNEAVNIHINSLRSAYPSATVAVRILPDGVMNLQRHPLPWHRVAWQCLRKCRALLDPALDFHVFNGDRTGADASIVDRIYIIQGLSHQYDPAKVVEVAMTGTRAVGSSGKTGRALVIGQPLVGFRRMAPEAMKTVTAGIRDFLREAGITQVDYKAHPRDAAREFYDDSYREITVSVPLEKYLFSAAYDVIIGVSSTGLIMARLIVPRECRVVSFGRNLVDRSAVASNTIEDEFRSLGIEVLRCKGSAEQAGGRQ